MTRRWGRRGIGVVDGEEWETSLVRVRGSTAAVHGRQEQEHRLKKHYGRWMDIVRSLELESFILTKLTKPSVPVNLVGPQVSLPLWWVPTGRGVFIFCAQ